MELEQQREDKGQELHLAEFHKDPLEHVVRAQADPKVEWETWRGWRVPGVKVPGVRFYAVRGHRDKILVIYLKDETYERLVTEVDDPTEVAENINDAVEALTRS